MRPMTPTTALLWRQWRETRWALFATTGLAAALAYGLSTVQDGRESYGARALDTFASLIMTVIAATTGLALLFSQGNHNRLTSGLAAQWFALPIRNTPLALTLICYRIAAMAAVVGTSLTIFCIILRTPELVVELRAWSATTDTVERTVASVLSPRGAVSYCLVALAVFSWVQAFEWSLRRFSGWAAWCAHGGLVWGLVWMLNTYGAQSPVLTAAAAWTLIPAAVLAGTGLVFQRRGVSLRIAVPALVAKRQVHTRPFNTADEALRWIEWRAAARDVTRVCLVGVAGMLGWTVLQIARGTFERDMGVKLSDAPVYFSVVAGIGSVVIALPGGLYMFTRKSTLMRGGASGVFAALPVTTQRLSAAGFWATARLFATLAAAYAVGALVVAVAADLWLEESRSTLAQFLHWQSLAGLVLVLLTSFALYQGGRFLILIYALVMALIAVATIVSPEWLTEGDAYVYAYKFGYLVTVLVIAACAIFAWRNGHVDGRGVAWVCGSAVLMVATVTALLFVTHAWPNSTNAETFVLSAACHAACALPLVAWPAYLAWLRTR